MKLRSRSGKVAEMLELIDVYQQPSGFVDSIVAIWIQIRHAGRCPQAVHQRDLFAAAMTEDCSRACYLSQELSAFLGGKVRPAA